MGLLVDGKWVDQWYDTDSSKGRFERSAAQFRNWITSDGSPGPDGQNGFKAEPDRYHLYVSLACPWAHRTLIFRRLKGLENMISVSVVHPLMLDHGWTFQAEKNFGDKATGDSLYELDYLYQVYLKANPEYSGRVTVPVLWDRENQTIVSNESADIIRMFNSAFDQCGATLGDYYPESLRPEIERLNEIIYPNINNGVYRAGFATTQEAYEEAVLPLFETLDKLETLLNERRYLTGDTVTEADWRLFTTLIRFDPVYHGHFKCNIRRMVDYPNLSNYIRELYQWPGVAQTVCFDHIKGHYYGSHKTINPTGIIPVGPESCLDRKHNRS